MTVQAGDQAPPQTKFYNMKMTFCCPALVLALGLASSGLAQQLSSTDQINWAVLDDDTKRKLINQAADSKQSELLYAAMHDTSKRMQMYCLEKIATLPRRQQADLLARVLADDSILWRQGDERQGGIQGQIIQVAIQQQIQTTAFRLLNRNSEPLERMLTRAEANSLAEQLRSLQ